jgi:hypothetical protein
MKSLIILLSISFVLSQIKISQTKPRLIFRNIYLRGRIENGRCNCLRKTSLIGNECKTYMRYNKSGKFFCPNGRYYLDGNECKFLKVCSFSYTRFYNYSFIKEFPMNQIRVKKKYNNCIEGTRKNKKFKSFKSFNIPKYKFNESLRIAKPVIYLYPKKIMDISVQLNLKNSEIIVIYPKFTEKNIWNVRAKPNGDILIKDKIYPYLFWEAESYIEQEINEGFIVTEENAEKFLEEKLDILGLNEKEKTDFITFWLPVLLKNNMSICSFKSKKFYENYELNVIPKPDSIIRIFLSIKKLETSINIKEQKLVPNERKGFTVIEWGGSNILK